MKATLIFTTLFAALAAATPVDTDEDAKTRTVTVKLEDTKDHKSAPAKILTDGKPYPIHARFTGLGPRDLANRATITKGKGHCEIFKNEHDRVANIKSGGGAVDFPLVSLEHGHIVCK